ncbi:unnamed protein product [Adineta ricciae]|uniref:Uncharacterized protein n=1 Tax=Adineta ricciae TaxID=249248 RepID=A0A814PVZ1_ADIRI|nr:unnamed protein product [Adineta ricciae]
MTAECKVTDARIESIIPITCLRGQDLNNIFIDCSIPIIFVSNVDNLSITPRRGGDDIAPVAVDECDGESNCSGTSCPTT